MALAAILAVALTACAGGAVQANEPRESASGLPVASAPTPSDEAAAPLESSTSASDPQPQWVEPGDPVAAYRELMDKLAYMRANPSLDLVREIYARRSPMARLARRDVRQLIERGSRMVDGRTVLETVTLQAKDGDTALLDVRSREEGWVAVDANGARTNQPTQCEDFGVELRDGGDGWRIARLIVDDDDKSFWRCES